MTTPDPQTVREIARKFLTDPDLSADELDYVVRSYIGYVSGAEHTAWRDAVRADAGEATVTTTASWPDEQPAAEQAGGWARHAVELLTAVVDPECNSDSYGNCATHGVLVLEAGAQCPHALARAFLAGSRAHLGAMAAEQDGDEDHRGDDASNCPACSANRHQAQYNAAMRAVDSAIKTMTLVWSGEAPFEDIATARAELIKHFEVPIARLDADEPDARDADGSAS